MEIRGDQDLHESARIPHENNYTSRNLFFSEAPISQLFPGVIGIVLAGLIIIWREKKLSIKDDTSKKLH